MDQYRTCGMLGCGRIESYDWFALRERSERGPQVHEIVMSSPVWAMIEPSQLLARKAPSPSYDSQVDKLFVANVTFF